MSTTNRQWILKSRPEGEISDQDLDLVESSIPDLADGQFLVRTVYLSVDPTNRMWMSEQQGYLPPVEIGSVMRGISIGLVEASKHDGFAKGDIVSGLGGWQEYYATDGQGFSKLPKLPGVPLDAMMGLLSMVGYTAYFGLLEIGQPKEGETVVVSAAAGAVGSIVGQIAKIKGCRAVGIAGSDEKCRWITEDLGYDAAINYKTQDVYEALKEACPDGIDIDFENVGGPIFDSVLRLINLRARIVLCGLISQYNAKEPQPGPYALGNILIQRARMEGFIILDYAPRFGEAAAQMGQWLQEGKLKYKVDVLDGLENTLEGLRRLFTGANMGKQLIRVSPES